MIAKMLKLTLLCQVADRDHTLERLRDLGVVHVAHVRRPGGDDLAQARARLDRLRHVLEILPPPDGRRTADRTPREVAAEAWQLGLQRKEQQARIEALRLEKQRIEPFGAFEPDAIRRLAAKGVSVRLYHAGARQRLDIPAGVAVREVGRSGKDVYLAAFGRGPFELNAREVKPPDLSPAALERRLEEERAGLRGTDEALAGCARHRAAIEALAHSAEDHVGFLETRAGMGASHALAYLQGFIPADAEPALRQAAGRHGWGLLLAEPAADEPAPTLVRRPRWVKPIQAVFDFIGVVPGYREADISAVFLLFFSLFFAMLVGDAGYGAILLALTVWARRRYPALPRHALALLALTGSATLVWGVLTGTYFGIARLPAPLERLKVGWLTDPNASQDNLMGLCFLIGAVHLTIAHAWNAWQNRRSWRLLAQLGWICTTWALFFAARTMVLGHPFPQVMLAVLAVGVALVVLFMTPVKRLKTDWFQHVVLPLNLVGNFVDLVSYIRLFAVGTATLAVAQAFNEMALGAGGNSWLRLPGTVLILLVGHTLNIALAAMGVIVHGVRLNLLEFSSHLGMQWGGTAYRPFARAAAPAPGKPAAG